MRPQGSCTLKSKLNHTDYFWGELSEIEGKTIPYMEFAVDKSSILCVVPDKGLVDVDIRDVESHKPMKQPFEILQELLRVVSDEHR